jgi:hypothetical protein
MPACAQRSAHGSSDALAVLDQQNSHALEATAQARAGRDSRPFLSSVVFVLAVPAPAVVSVVPSLAFGRVRFGRRGRRRRGRRGRRRRDVRGRRHEGWLGGCLIAPRRPNALAHIVASVRQCLEKRHIRASTPHPRGRREHDDAQTRRSPPHEVLRKDTVALLAMQREDQRTISA